MDKMSGADILERLKTMTTVNVTNWAKEEGQSFGPLVREDRGTRYNIEKAANFIKKLIKGKVMHFPEGREDVEFYTDFVVLEIHGAGLSSLRTLQRRYVIVKDSETEEYVCYLSWLR